MFIIIIMPLIEIALLEKLPFSNTILTLNNQYGWWKLLSDKTWLGSLSYPTGEDIDNIVPAFARENHAHAQHK